MKTGYWFAVMAAGMLTVRIFGAEPAAVTADIQAGNPHADSLGNAGVWHFLPRPDGKNWDGIQYHDPATQKGVVYLFKPAAGPDTMKIRLRGLQADARYRVSFEDGSNPAVEKSGEELTAGIDVTLKGEHVSELMFFE